MIDYFATSNQARQDHVAALDEERDKFIAKYKKGIFKAIGDQFEAAATRVEDGKDFKIDDKALAQVVEVIYLDAGSSFARVALHQIEAIKQDEDDEDAVLLLILAYIAANLGVRIAAISKTLRRIITGIVTEGRLEDIPLTPPPTVPGGAPPSKETIPGNIRKWWADHGKAKAESLAASETVNASNLGADAAFETVSPAQVPEVLDPLGPFPEPGEEPVPSGRKWFKFWVTTMDGNQRDTHGRANGQEREKSKPFNVGSSKLNFPGDGSLGADAGELVNCRCGTTFTLR